MRRRRLALAALGLLLLGSCTAAGLSLAGGRGGGGGTVTVQADVDDGPVTARAPLGPGATASDGPAGTTSSSLREPQATLLGRGTETVSTAPSRPGAQRDGPQQVLVTLSGSAEGLVPGRRGQLLHVVVGNDAANEDDLLLTLTSVTAAARGPAGSCGPEDLVVTAYRAGPHAPTYTVRRGRSVVVPLQVVFVDRLDRDQTDCAGASFPLTLTATAEVTA